jgi:hypothetical protein
VQNIRVTGSLASSSTYLGGIAGDFSGKLIDVSVDAVLTATAPVNDVGGLLGRLGHFSASSVSFSSFTGSIDLGSNAGSRIGGLVGSSGQSSISESFFDGDLRLHSAVTDAGGLVGMTFGSVDSIFRDSYAIGTAQASTNTGGILSRTSAGIADIRRSYTRINDSNSAMRGVIADALSNLVADWVFFSDAFAQDAILSNTNRKSDAELKTQATFTDWDFTEVWRLDPDSMPRLRWQH